MRTRRTLRAVRLVNYGQSHDVPFQDSQDGWAGQDGGDSQGTGATPPRCWDAWSRRGRGRGLGHLDRSAVTAAVRGVRRTGPDGGADRQHRTALSLLGMSGADLRRWYRPRRRAVTSSPPSVDRLIPLRTLKCSDQRPLGCPVHLPAGSRLNAVTHATVASSLPRDVQEVPGVVLHSGPPATTEQAADRGTRRPTPDRAGADEGTC